MIRIIITAALYLIGGYMAYVSVTNHQDDFWLPIAAGAIQTHQTRPE